MSAKEIIKIITNFFIENVYAERIEIINVPPPLLVSDLLESLFKFASLTIIPFVALIVAILYAKNTPKGKVFFKKFIFNGFKKILKISFVFLFLYVLASGFLILFLEYVESNYAYGDLGHSLTWWLLGFFFGIIALNSIVSGIIYLFFAFKDREFFKVALAFIFILPAIGIFSWEGRKERK